MSSGFVSTLATSYGSKSLPNQIYRTLENPNFIPNDGNPIEIKSGQVVINDSLTVTGGITVDGLLTASNTAITGTLGVDGIATFNDLVMAMAGIGANVGTVTALTVSTINGAPITPSAGNGTYISSVNATFANTSNQVVTTFSNVPADAIMEAFVSGSVNWTSPPQAGDLFTINFSGGGNTIQDTLTINLPPASYAVGINNATGSAYFNLGGIFTTSASNAGVATLNFRGNVGFPADYSISFFNGNIRFLSLQ